MSTRSQPENVLAIASLLFSASMWGLIWYPLRLLDQAGMSAVWTSLVMYIAASLVAIPVFFRKHDPIKPYWGELLSLAIAAGIANIAFLVALTEGEVMRVMLLFYLSPLWSVLIGRFWLKEKLSFISMVMFVIAMFGSLIMLWNPQIGWPWPHGLADWLALAAGIAFSVHNVLARKLGQVSMAIKTTVVWWGVMIVSALVLFWQSSPIPSVSLFTWGGAWLLGWLGIVAMTVAVLYGVARMPVYRSAVIMLFELVVAAFSAWWLTDEAMSLQEWLGGALIIAAAYGIAKAAVLDEQEPS